MQDVKNLLCILRVLINQLMYSAYNSTVGWFCDTLAPFSGWQPVNKILHRVFAWQKEDAEVKQTDSRIANCKPGLIPITTLFLVSNARFRSAVASARMTASSSTRSNSTMIGKPFSRLSVEHNNADHWKIRGIIWKNILDTYARLNQWRFNYKLWARRDVK